MTAYLIKRTLQSIFVVFIVSSGCFILMHAMPGTQFTHMFASLSDKLHTITLNHEYGFDKPILIQYVNWVKGIVHGQFIGAGQWGFAQTEALWPYVWHDIELVGSAWVLALLIAIPWGIYNGRRPYGVADTVGSIFAYVGFAIPAFVLGYFFQLVFALELDWFPPSSMYDVGQEGQFSNLIPHMVMPVTVLAFGFLVSYMKYMRNSYMEAMPGDFVRTARAKGVPERRIAYMHVLRNAVIPVITVLAMDVKNIIGGAAVVEVVFNWPGMGVLLVHSAEGRRYDIVIAIAVVTAVIVVACNWIADIIYAFVDPRLRHNER